MGQKRYQIKIAYEGTAFHGWQEQNPPDAEPLRTVQATVRDAISNKLGRAVELVGASRTDAGVHALGQVAHFDADTPIPTNRMALAINALLPPDVEILEVNEVDASFDAISDVKRKQYLYRIWNENRRPLDKRNVVHHYKGRLDEKQMDVAAKLLIGEHDFASFAAVGHGRESTVRTIYDCQVFRPASYPGEVHVTVCGSGFLWNMVRIIAGTLVEVGRGYWEPEFLEQMFVNPDRRKAGPTLPPTGLWLQWIEYAQEAGE